jgi:hypothetical protein
MSTDELEHALTAPHEPNVVSARAIWKAGAALVVVMVASGGLIEGLTWWFARRIPAAREASSAAQTQDSMKTGVPALDPRQAAALAELRSIERTYLNQYEWVDQQAGLARIPIARAMEIISSSGLPPVVGKPTVAGSSSHE